MLGTSHRRSVFAKAYFGNLWGNPESRSGSGSSIDSTDRIRRHLPGIFAQYGTRFLLDAPCGDFHWIGEVTGHLDRYLGVDIVPDLIEQNIRLYETSTVGFLQGDITVDPLPRADMILCRDCLIHLPTRLIVKTLRNFKCTHTPYLMLTNDRSAPRYHDIPVGSFRNIDFTQPPFSFPVPQMSLNEDAGGKRQLCLWRLEDLSV
jgi:hypothetical protein